MIGLRLRDPGPVRAGGKQAITADWANRMRDCIMAIARHIPQNTRTPAEWLPPRQWEVTANGDDTVTVAPGFCTAFCGTSNPLSTDYYEFTGDTETVTANGYIYFKIDFESETWGPEIILGGTGDYSITPANVILKASPTASIEFSTSEPTSICGSGGTGGGIGSTEIYFLLATVTLTDSIASVTNQVQEGNIHISIQDLEAASSPP